MSQAKEIFYVELPISATTDADLLAAVAAITANAPSSDIYKTNLAIQDTVTAVAALAKTWTNAREVVSADENKLLTDKKVRDSNRILLTQKLQLFRSQVQDAAPTAADARATGINTRERNAAPAPLVAPTGGVLTPSPRVKGQFTASANAVPGIRTYAMQISPDPIGPNTYQDVDGYAKSRTFKDYASNTRWWLRFAAMRGKARSDWSPPVSILIA